MGLWNLEVLFCVPVHTDCFCECILKGCGSILQIKLHVAVYLKICICVIVMWNPTSEPQWGKTLIVGSSEGGKYSKLFIETLCLIHATYVIVTLRGAVLIIQNSSEWKFLCVLQHVTVIHEGTKKELSVHVLSDTVRTQVGCKHIWWCTSGFLTRNKEKVTAQWTLLLAMIQKLTWSCAAGGSWALRGQRTSSSSRKVQDCLSVTKKWSANSKKRWYLKVQMRKTQIPLSSQQTH